MNQRNDIRILEIRLARDKLSETGGSSRVFRMGKIFSIRDYVGCNVMVTGSIQYRGGAYSHPSTAAVGDKRVPATS